MNVTKIEQVTRTKFKVYLDGAFAFVLYKGELSRFGVCEGRELPDDVAEKIRREVILKRAKLRAMHLLEDMDRTEAGLREKLRHSLYPEEAVNAAVEYVRSFGYLDDARYAENFIRSRQKKKSSREIRAALLQKGLTCEQIDRAFEACREGEDEHAAERSAIRAVLEKKRFDPAGTDEAEMRKIYGYLARKGFGYDTVRQVIQNYDENA
ncbi:regulatory protein RecX [Clostridium sp. Marseille-P3244]|uniref:regulatory protein RecX n=1 Tax=Clostridium sp. Marseille-P3244 TaxID=1871020 RepID=UPI0009306ABD|nr:regulatory protein RecX [Clostridium sp. Marseille-P3244]